MQREVELGVLRHVHEAAAGPHGAVQGGELVVGGRDERHELLADERLPLRVVQRLLDAGVHDAHAGGGVLHVVVDQLGVVLRADAGQVAALGLGDAQAVEGVLHVVGQAVPVRLLIGVGLDIGDDVVHVEAGDGRAPVRRGHVPVDFQRLQAVLEHPLRLVLLLRDLADDLGRQARLELLGAVAV